MSTEHMSIRGAVTDQQVSEKIDQYTSVSARSTDEGIFELSVEMDGQEKAFFLTEKQLMALYRIIPQIMPVQKFK